MFKLALIQMVVIGGDPWANIGRAESWIERAARGGAAVALLPEALNLGWMHPSAATMGEPIPGGPICGRLRAAARNAGLYVCGGLIERQGDEIFNAAVLIDPSGEVILHHRKLNELEIAHDCYGQGTRLGVARTPLGNIGVHICADAFAGGQVLSRALGYMGADIILSPCAWAVAPDHDNRIEPYGQLWRDNYQPVARDFKMWIAGASSVGWIAAGPWSGWKCIGCSMAVDPEGKEVFMGPYGHDAEALGLVDIDIRPRPARGDGWSRYWSGLS